MRAEVSQVSDVALLQAIARGDEASLARLYDQYRVILFGLLVRILNSREEAEDVLQEVFLQVWRRAADFDEERGRPFTWLVTLARSRAIDRLKGDTIRVHTPGEFAKAIDRLEKLTVKGRFSPADGPRKAN